MSGFLNWLPDVLRSAGIDTYVMPGAERRTSRSAGLSVKGIVWHHTATGPNWQDGHVANLLRDGRIDLAGPLAQVGIERDGTWVLVALGRANHNGYGHFGNDSLGLEFYNSGVGEPWPDVQVESGVRGTAAVLRHLGKPISVVMGHRETDPRRKIDPAGLNMTTIRQRVDAAMRHKPQEDTDLYGTEVIAAYGEAGYLLATLHPDKLAQHWRDIRAWTHAIYAKPEHERAGGVAYIRAQLGLP